VTKGIRSWSLSGTHPWLFVLAVSLAVLAIGFAGGGGEEGSPATGLRFGGGVLLCLGAGGLFAAFARKILGAVTVPALVLALLWALAESGLVDLGPLGGSGERVPLLTLRLLADADISIHADEVVGLASGLLLVVLVAAWGLDLLVASRETPEKDDRESPLTGSRF
jgi:hypothetical protein